MKEEFIQLHKDLRKYRYFYYVSAKSLISDYEYDMLEKQYTKIADELSIPEQYRVDCFVGYSDEIPMNPFNLI